MAKTVTELGFVPGWSVAAAREFMVLMRKEGHFKEQSNTEWMLNEAQTWPLGYIECNLCAGTGISFYPADADETCLECSDCGGKDSRILGWLHPNGYWVANDDEVESWQAEQLFGG